MKYGENDKRGPQLIHGVQYIVTYWQRSKRHSDTLCSLPCRFIRGGKQTYWLAANGAVRRIKDSDIEGWF